MASLSELFQFVIDLLMDHHIYMHSNKIRKKVGSRRTTILKIWLSSSIFWLPSFCELILYNVLLVSMYICFIGKGRAGKVSSTNLLGYNFELNSSSRKSRRQEDDQVSSFGCPHSFFGRRGHEDPDMYRLINHYTLNKRWNVFRRSSKKIQTL